MNVDSNRFRAFEAPLTAVPRTVMEQLSQRLEEETAIIALVSAALGGFTGLPASVMSKAGMNCVGLYFVPKIVHIIITFWIIYKEEKQVKNRSKHHIASYTIIMPY